MRATSEAEFGKGSVTTLTFRYRLTSLEVPGTAAGVHTESRPAIPTNAANAVKTIPKSFDLVLMRLMPGLPDRRRNRTLAASPAPQGPWRINLKRKTRFVCSDVVSRVAHGARKKPLTLAACCSIAHASGYGVRAKTTVSHNRKRGCFRRRSGSTSGRATKPMAAMPNTKEAHAIGRMCTPDGTE